MFGSRRWSCVDFSGLLSFLSYPYGHHKGIGHDGLGESHWVVSWVVAGVDPGTCCSVFVQVSLSSVPGGTTAVLVWIGKASVSMQFCKCGIL
jgi:hypothetical protein